MYRPYAAFQPKGRFISVIGSGGKTTLLRVLSQRLPGTVVLTTSTHMFPFPDVPLVDTGDEDTPANRARVLSEFRAALTRGRVVCLGRRLPSGKLTAPTAVPFEELLSEADYVLVEADGAAGRPLKAHRPFEPVVPACSTMTVCVAGASGIGRSAAQVCHCPDLFAALAEMTPDEPVREEHIARALNREALADCYLVNQVDVLEDPDGARRLCDLIDGDAFPCSLGPR